VRVAAGEKLPIAQDDITMTGHAIEARVYAEDPANGFLPTGGGVLDLAEPRAPGVRVDSGLAKGTVVGSDYDPMLAKVIAHAADRPAAIRALDRALANTAVLGVTTNVEFLRFLLADRDVIAGRLDTGLLDRRTPDFAAAQPGDEELVAAADRQIWLARAGRTAVIDELREAPVRPDDEHSGDAELLSPMPGSVVAVGIEDGGTVTAGAVVVAVEAMKMEHALTAPVDGVVELLVAVGDQVKVGQPLARITASEKVEES
jgi:acetyl/propionyl-CoA carboxylase alpha subunit